MGAFPLLFSPTHLGKMSVKNRAFIPGHATRMAEGGKVGERILAYHRARAEADVGMIVTEVNVVHSTYAPDLRLSVMSDDAIPGLARLAAVGKPHDCRILGQLFHPGRVAAASIDGSVMATYAPSESPDEFYKSVPSPLTEEAIWELVAAYGDGARRMAEAGLDGVELISSMGYLISQFLNPRINRRTDAFGGSLENRLRFLREVVADVRRKVGPDLCVGIRISADEMDDEGLHPHETLEALKLLDADGTLDYFNIIAATTASYAGWMHIIPHMVHPPAYIAPTAGAIRKEVSRPILVAGRINQPHEAEKALRDGHADMIGMVRAHICDPKFSAKAKAGRTDDIRACIACNQACIGHGLKGFFTSCIQYPETGREIAYAHKTRASQARRVMVVGGGPAGMKAAAVAAERGHEVDLYEAGPQLGGQALLAQQLPGRAEFGGIVTNLAREMEIHGVRVHRSMPVTLEVVRERGPEAIVVATGARPQVPAAEGLEDAHVVDSWSVVCGEANVGTNVVIWDWRSDWVGLGLAQMLAQNGCHVRLAVNAMVPGERLPSMVRDHWMGELHKLGVEVIPYVRLFGADADTVYFEHVTAKVPVILEGVDTLVSHHAPRREATLLEALQAEGIEATAIGDCLSPRTCEEAVLEGLKIGFAL